MRFNRLSYQILVVFVIVIVVCLGASGWFMLQISEDIITSKISEGDRHLARRIAREVEAEIASVKPVVTLLAGSQGLRLMEATEVKREIDLTQRSFPEIISIYVADVEGEQIARTGTEELENVSNVWSFQVARGGDELISDIYPAPVTSEPMQSIALPIMDNGTVVGVVSADISFRRVMLSVMDIDVGKNGSVAVVASNGRVVAHTYMEQLPELNLSKSPAVEAVLDGQEGAIQGYTDELGRQVFGSYSPIWDLGWGVLIQKPLADIDAEIGQLRTTILWATIGAVLLAVLAGWLMSRQITKPIYQLASASERIAHGDLSTPVEVKSSNEIGVLAYSFNQMMVSLKRSRDELERWSQELDKKVQERTVELRAANEKVQQRADELVALYEMGCDLAVTLDLEVLLPAIAQRVTDILEADRCAVFLFDEKAGMLRARAAHGYMAERLADFSYRPGEEIVGQAYVMGETQYVPDLDQVPDLPRRDATRAVLAVPLVSPTAGTLGVLSITSLRLEAFTPDQQRLLETVAGQIARVVENARLYEAAQEADRCKSAFLASMSHELRTPLNSIIGFIGIILQGLAGPLNSEQEKQLNMVYGSAKHLLALINDVLDISKIEAGQLEIASEPFDVREEIEKVVRTVTPLAEKKGLALVAEVAPEVGQITSDRRRVEQILINLANNAIKFTEKGEVRVECQVSADGLVMRVADTGIGIKPEDMGKLFEPFRQVETGLTRQYEGTGLGLSICKSLVEMLGGEIWAESEWGVGSTFTFTLPIKMGG
ncbi:MAG: ATP-binding protein [Chloroflexota bacterium]|nr:ATP-binding protein [Chloroflexota bacterium]